MAAELRSIDPGLAVFLISASIIFTAAWRLDCRQKRNRKRCRK